MTKEILIRGIIANPKEPKIHKVVDFCVDTGAEGSVMISQQLAKELNLRLTKAKDKVILADETRIEYWSGTAYIIISGEGIVLKVDVVEKCDPPIIGMDLLDLFHFQIDVRKKMVLKPVRRIKYDSAE